MRFKNIALSKEVEARCARTSRTRPSCRSARSSLEGAASEAEAQAMVDKMYHDLKAKGVDRQKLEAKIEPRFTLEPAGTSSR